MKTLVLGGSLNPARYSYRAIHMLRNYNFETVSIGLKSGMVSDVMISTGRNAFENIHTITFYLNPQRQEAFYEYVLSLAPKRIIFNPGTENLAFEKLATASGIECLQACTLVMLSTGQYEKKA